MTKKTIKLIVGLVLTVAVSIGMFTFGNGLDHFDYESPSETFVGVVSKESYSSKVETAKAFLANELTGAAAEPQYTGYQKIADLSIAEIENLALEQDMIDDVESAESIDVYYTCDDTNKSMNTCLLKMNGKYRYYVAMSSIGEALTNTYFDTVLDGSKYLNCTSTTTVNLREVSAKSTIDSTYRQTIMFDDDLAYIDQQFPGQEHEMYFAEENNSIEAYLKHPKEDDGKFYSLSEINNDLYSQNLRVEVYITKGGEKILVESLEKLEDITDFIFMMQLDASYFVKTSFGFSMPDDKYKEVCKVFAGEDAYAEMEEAWDEYHIHFNADYYVAEGRLSACKTVLTMSDGDDIFAITITANYTDFGTTELTFPISTEG